ncbi:tetratricopeptide repeat protein [Massilia sp. Dwa41.01b]|uniref:tetratricopeptide repeat-containing response regulator n=1 Tax=unclassified Massilia TaxID=2609279 RepID=UPI0015FF7BCA|nr:MULTISPECIES: tetratricopeptide repeat-containing response regulator [unclassified Massilia]QNA87714.1 tetratricopeptide repeat protein [Massilia sp. Dwa41.01b]
MADDVAGVRQLLREALRSLGAKNIDQAASGGEAIALLARTRYDVVLCDFNLGEGKNGQQVLEEARVRNLLLPSSVWMMVSAEKSVESVMGAAEHQPDAYLVKPITEGVLLTRLNRAWQRKQIFRPIDQACAEKDYLRAARLCQEQIDGQDGGHRVHEIDLLRMQARLMEKSGEPERARACYERVLAQREYQWARVGLAKIRMANGDLEAARQMFQGVIAENRYYIDAYDQLAQVYAAMGKLEEACAILERAAKLSPNSVPRQRKLGTLGLKLGNVALAERAFRKCIAIGAWSVLRSPDAYLGLARVCGLKNDPKEAVVLLQGALREFGEAHPDLALRAKITEGLVYHESGDYRHARKAGDELEALLASSEERPDVPTCLEMATLLFAVGVKDAPVELLCYLTRNNHDNASLLEEVQAIFEQARMGDEGGELIREAKKEAADLMNGGVLLWKTGKLGEAVAWMRKARARLPNNQRILFNAAQVLVSQLREQGFDAALADEAHAVLMHVDRLQPGQPRFAQLMEQLAALAPRPEALEVDTTA